jgi:hypothetical protein
MANREPFFAFKSVSFDQEASDPLNELAAGINTLYDQLLTQGVLPELDASGEVADVAITVRMPQGLHAQLKRQAHEYQVSLNQLCLARLAAATKVHLPKAKRR